MTTTPTLQGKALEFYTKMLNSIESNSRGDEHLHVVLESNIEPMLNLPFLTNRVSFTLSAAFDREETTFSATAGHGISVGDIIEIAEGSGFVQGEVLVVATDDITMDMPATMNFTTAAICQSSSDNIEAANGTLASPVIFSITPLATPLQIGDITRLIFVMEDDSAMDFTTFASALPVTNGFVLRYKLSSGNYINIFNFKSNGEIIEQSFDYNFETNIGNNVRGFTARSTWNGQDKRNTAVRIDGSAFESLELLCQDNVAALLISKIRIIAQGHAI